MSFWQDNGTKIYGSATAMLGFAMSAIGSGQMDRPLGDSKDVWMFFLGMAVTGLGGATVTRGLTNSTQVRVAEAMQTAINTPAGAPLPQSVKDFTITKPEDPKS